jgi:hypothetical protein
MNKIYVLNSLIVPIDFEKNPKVQVKLSRISVQEAKGLLKGDFISAIGHEGSAQVLSQLLGIKIPVNRISVFFEKGDIGVHLFLKQRLPEGKVLSEEELKNLDFWLVLSEVKE